MATDIKVNFAFEKSTPGAHRFQEIDKKGEKVSANDGAVIGSLYVRKTAMADAPKKLEVTIKAG